METNSLYLIKEDEKEIIKFFSERPCCFKKLNFPLLQKGLCLSG